MFVTIVLLMAVGLIALYTNRAAIMEQRLSANEIRTKQAFAAANAGLEHALAYMRMGGVDHDNNDTADTVVPVTLATGSYKVAYCAPAPAAPPDCPATPPVGALICATSPGIADLTNVLTVSCGWSDDSSSVHRLVQGMRATKNTNGNGSSPLVTRGSANLLTGGASIFNFFNDLTVWSGGSLLGQSNTGKTFIRDTVAYPTASTSDPYLVPSNSSPGCNNPPTGYQCSTQGSTLGHDTVSGDTNLSSKSVPEYFQSFFGQTPEAYKAETANVILDSTTLSSIDGMRGTTIWVDGNATLSTQTIGTPDRPVKLIIDGDLDMSANLVIYGLVYVKGNITSQGTPTIYGALLGAGNATVTGNLKVVYDPKAFGSGPGEGKAGKVPGSWRDW
jgi:hypothetical protein